MLSLCHDKQTGQARLVIRNDFAQAWIEHHPRLSEDFEHLGEIPDWRLWVQLSGKSASRLKCIRPVRVALRRRRAMGGSLLRLV